ncbi:MAG: alpha/beta hydrolase family protein [Proteobacteria bacterium]|nr:alpha/beta hydrolase family protein [Pseudomonadota bacterium]
MKLLVTLLLISGLASALTTPDYEKEARWASFIEDGLMDGDVVWIENGEKEFLSILTEAESDSNKVAIIVHGLGVHPDWTGVIQPLRLSLTEQGYHTLAIQLPVLANGVEGKEYVGLFSDSDKRIQASVDYIKSTGKEADLLVAHSLGATMATHYFSNTPKHPFKKFVAVGMNGGSVPYLPSVDIPLLDIYGTADIDPVLKTVIQRREAAKNNSQYVQRMIQGDHFFNEQSDLLTQAVGDWLK